MAARRMVSFSTFYDYDYDMIIINIIMIMMTMIIVMTMIIPMAAQSFSDDR